MSGRLTVVGLGPGPDDWVTPAARKAVTDADIVLGYTAYTNRITLRPGQRIEASDNREELQRARRALEIASAGETVAIVSGGDPGVFAMAAAVFETLDNGPKEWREIDIRVEPGVTAMLAAAARVGAPLGHDFCAISLSDNLKPWQLIANRLRLAAEADFVMAIYNPSSRARPDQIGKALAILGQHCAPDTVVVFARATGRMDEEIDITTLAEAHTFPVDMRTLVIVGSSATRLIVRPDGRFWVYTPRFAGDA